MQEAKPLLVFPLARMGGKVMIKAGVVITDTAHIGFNLAFVSNTVLSVVSERLPLQSQPQNLLIMKPSFQQRG